MSQAEFTLQQRDRVRQLKDTLARYAVTVGGIGILFALGLIFFYLVMMVLPIFTATTIEPKNAVPLPLSAPPVAMSVDSYGEHAFVLQSSGELGFVDLQQSSSALQPEFQPASKPMAFAQMPASDGWMAMADENGQVSAILPEYAIAFTEQGKTVTPRVRQFRSQGVQLEPSGQAITQLAFAIGEQRAAFVGSNAKHELFSYVERGGRIWRTVFAAPITDLIDLTMTPDGRYLYLLTPSDLIVAFERDGRYEVREVIDVTQGDPHAQAFSIELLSGAQSLLIQHKNNRVTQWFDVVEQGQRTLTYIRAFALEQPSPMLLPDYYRKGFYAFSPSGEVASYHTTSDERSFSQPLLTQLPKVAAISSNEKQLMVYSDGILKRFVVNNPHPEVSFSSLWRSVWYEGYPEPQFVWQSTSASDDFEAKFSLVPIAFGTIKAALFAMIFAVPIAVLAAVYTAYFMSAPMRRVVKPAIEIMEALPTVIIGFLAGLWLAPIVENHLPAVLGLVVLLPLSTIIVAWLWHRIPSVWLEKVPNGWHGLILLPVLVFVSVLAIRYSMDIEQAWFGGDMRVYLAQIGIDYDQRNAMVVGIAMGFAVIPTIFTIAEDAIFSVPKHLSDGSLALGATQWQTLTHVVLLTASPGIFSAIMMGLGRAVGETMIVLMATGNTPVMDWNLFEGMRSLAATIAIEMPESEVASSHYRLLFLAALILFVFTFLVNSLAEWVRQRLRDKYRAL